MSSLNGDGDFAFMNESFTAVPDNLKDIKHSYLLNDNAVGFSEANFPDLHSVDSKETATERSHFLHLADSNDTATERTHFKSPHTDISNYPKHLEKPEDTSNVNCKKISQMSPDHNGHYTYHQWQQSDVGDMRHQLLVQRTFINHDDHHEPRTSSPLRKIRICTVASGVQTVTVSPSSGTLPHNLKNTEKQEKNIHLPFTSLQLPFLHSPNDNAVSVQEIFLTPNRNQHKGHPASTEVTTSHSLTVSMLSPASTPSLRMTPGRQFVNPFEIGHDRMHMPMYSPNMFTVTESVSSSMKKESFWSIENAAMLMPADIKETEIHLQHRYQQRIDREQDARLQTAINKFFSNEHIAPSPWSEKIKHVLPQTPGSYRSVSSQTDMSVPPHDDLLSKIEDKYINAVTKCELSPSSDFYGNNFIRRKLLHQLNDNDSELFYSSPIPARLRGESSPSPLKQATPEWERDIQGNHASGHFSSSPICQISTDKGHHTRYENDMLASPELSPIAGRNGKSLRSSGIFYTHHNEDSPGAVMQLDFSSILDEAGGIGVETKADDVVHHKGSTQLMDSIAKTDTLNASDDCQFLASNLLHESDANSNNSRQGTIQFKGLAVTSAMSTESMVDQTVTMPQSQSSLDTGYHTTSLQTTNQESVSCPNLTSQENVALTCTSHNLHSFPVGFSSDFFSDLQQPKVISPKNSTKQWSNSSLNGNGSFLDYEFESSKKKSSSSDDVACFQKKDNVCRVRKVMTVSDMRHSKEKSSVSRDLIQSFNEELEKSCSNITTRGSWLDSEDFVSAAYKNERKDTLDQKMLLDSTPFYRFFPSAITKRSDDKCTAHDESSDFNVSMQGTTFYNTSTEDKKITDVNNSGKYAKFFEEDSSLKEAKLLLYKSEELRNKFSQPKVLESDSLYQAISKCINNDDKENSLKEITSLSETSSFRIEAENCSTPTSKMLDSVREKINQVEGSKLGSEIAAEILKRAGDDLARLTSLLGYNKH